jgi:hypothetical protein
MLSAEVAVMVAPRSGFRRAAKPPAEGPWFARPLLVVLVLSCCVSLMTAGRITLRLALPAMVYGSVVPLLQVGSLAVVCRGRLPFRRAVELFFVGHGPWSLALLAFAAAWGFAPASAMYAHPALTRLPFGVALVWSLWIDYWFFREVAGGGGRRAIFDLALQRVLAWGPGLLLFVAPAGWQVVTSAVGR